MTHRKDQLLDAIFDLFNAQTFAVLSTSKSDQPYASLVAFAENSRKNEIYLLTPNTTRKYKNLINNPKVAVLVNNSRNKTDDIFNAVSVTITGSAQVVASHEREDVLFCYLKKHPYMKAFSASPTTAVIRVKIDQYIMVNQFQNIEEIKVNQ